MKLFYFTIILLFSILVNAQAPAFNWARSIGGPNEDHSNSVAIDALGNVYTTGYFTGIADLDPGVGVFNLSTTSANAVFVSKLDAAGNFLWGKQLSGVSNAMQFMPSLTLDTLGNVFVRNNDSISKISTIGNLLWTKSTGGESTALTTDVNGNVIITGLFQGLVDFNSSAAIDTLRSGGFGTNLFMLKLDANGNYVWVKKGVAYSIYSCITTDVFGNIYTVINGISNFSFSFEKSDPSGNVIWTRIVSGNSSVSGNSICVDAFNNAYITGSYAGSLNFGSFGLSNNVGGLDVFILKFDSYGSETWARSIGGNNDDYGKSINIDAFNNLYIMGTFKGHAYFQQNPPFGSLFTFQNSTGNPSNPDVLITKFSSSNGILIWGASFGGGNIDDGSSMVQDKAGNIYITGSYDSTCDFDPSSGTYPLTTVAGSTDGYILKLGNSFIGVEELSKDNVLSVYPNPSNGNTTIKTKYESTYQLINSLGATIKSIQLNANNNFTVTINELPNGIYYIVGKENKQSVSQKIVVIK